MNEKHYSLSKIFELASGDSFFIKTIITTFIKEVLEDISMLEVAIVNQNHDLAYQIAHKTKPNLILFQIPINEEILEIEKWAKHKENKNIKPTFQKVQNVVNLAINQIKKEYPN